VSAARRLGAQLPAPLLAMIGRSRRGKPGV